MKTTKNILFSVIIALLFMVMQGCSQPSKEHIENPIKEMRTVPEEKPINQDEVPKEPMFEGYTLDLPKELHYPTNKNTIKNLSYNFHLEDRTDFIVSIKIVSGDLYFQIIDVDVDRLVYEFIDLQDEPESITLEPGD